VPPVAVALHDTAVPTVPVVGQLMVADTASGAMVMVVEAVAVFALASVAVTEIVKVPLLEYVVVKLGPDPDAGLPPVAVHANV